MISLFNHRECLIFKTVSTFFEKNINTCVQIILFIYYNIFLRYKSNRILAVFRDTFWLLSPKGHSSAEWSLERVCPVIIPHCASRQSFPSLIFIPFAPVNGVTSETSEKKSTAKGRSFVQLKKKITCLVATAKRCCVSQQWVGSYSASGKGGKG